MDLRKVKDYVAMHRKKRMALNASILQGAIGGAIVPSGPTGPKGERPKMRTTPLLRSKRQAYKNKPRLKRKRSMTWYK